MTAKARDRTVAGLAVPARLVAVVDHVDHVSGHGVMVVAAGMYWSRRL
jgi:hypothetical protein